MHIVTRKDIEQYERRGAYCPIDGLLVNNSGHLVLIGPGDGTRVMEGDRIVKENGQYKAYSQEVR